MLGGRRVTIKDKSANEVKRGIFIQFFSKYQKVFKIEESKVIALVLIGEEVHEFSLDCVYFNTRSKSQHKRLTIQDGFKTNEDEL